jgi:hypothetical protein
MAMQEGTKRNLRKPGQRLSTREIFPVLQNLSLVKKKINPCKYISQSKIIEYLF